MSKNADGWIRHRGGKCPVEVGTLIDIRCRDGLVRKGVPCGKDFTRTASMFWSHEGDGAEVMAYRLHKQAEQVEACSKPELKINLPGGYGEIYNAQAVEHGPIQWRDRITEIDATTKALTSERAELVQKLASEGFALIGRINYLLTEAAQKHEDMSDWRNWKIGDLLEVTGAGSHHFQIGVVVRFKRVFESDGKCGICEYIDGSDYWYLSDSHVKFHSRPSA